MAETKYAVVNTELMAGTDVRSKIRSFRFGENKTVDGKTSFEYLPIENGTVVVLKDLIDHDLWQAVEPAASTDYTELVLVATPELMYDERKKKLSDFINEEGQNATGLVLTKGDIFSVTKEAFEGTTTPALGNYVQIGSDCKLKLSTSAPTSGKIGKIVDEKIRKSGKFYGILVG